MSMVRVHKCLHAQQLLCKTVRTCSQACPWCVTGTDVIVFCILPPLDFHLFVRLCVRLGRREGGMFAWPAAAHFHSVMLHDSLHSSPFRRGRGGRAHHHTCGPLTLNPLGKLDHGKGDGHCRHVAHTAHISETEVLLLVSIAFVSPVAHHRQSLLSREYHCPWTIHPQLCKSIQSQPNVQLRDNVCGTWQQKCA